MKLVLLYCLRREYNRKTTKGDTKLSFLLKPIPLSNLTISKFQVHVFSKPTDKAFEVSVTVKELDNNKRIFWQALQKKKKILR